MQFQHVLIVDPDPSHAKRLKEVFVRDYKAKVTLAGRSDIGAEELKSSHKIPIDFVVLDVKQPDALDFGAVVKLRDAMQESVPLLVITDDPSARPSDYPLMFQALRAGANAYVTRGRLWRRFGDAVWLAVEKHQLSS